MTPNRSRYHETYEQWRTDPEGFWAEAAREIDWSKPADKIFDPDMGVFGSWFVGAECNACYNALDRHVENGRDDQVALIYDSPVTKHETHLYLSRALGRDGDARRRAATSRRQKRRPRHPLHADDSASRHRHACLRTDRRGAFGRLRWLRGDGACNPARRRDAETRAVGLLRHRDDARRSLQAAARRGDCLEQPQAAGLPDFPAPGISRTARRARS